MKKKNQQRRAGKLEQVHIAITTWRWKSSERKLAEAQSVDAKHCDVTEVDGEEVGKLQDGQVKIMMIIIFVFDMLWIKIKIIVI